jgi:hypothetical protein
METLNIELINPKAKKLLLNLESLDLIRIKLKPDENESFKKLLSRLRKNKNDAPTFEEITQEVEKVRKQRYAGKH